MDCICLMCRCFLHKPLLSLGIKTSKYPSFLWGHRFQPQTPDLVAWLLMICPFLIVGIPYWQIHYVQYFLYKYEATTENSTTLSQQEFHLVFSSCTNIRGGQSVSCIDVNSDVSCCPFTLPEKCHILCHDFLDVIESSSKFSSSGNFKDWPSNSDEGGETFVLTSRCPILLITWPKHKICFTKLLLDFLFNVVIWHHQLTPYLLLARPQFPSYRKPPQSFLLLEQ